MSNERGATKPQAPTDLTSRCDHCNAPRCLHVGFNHRESRCLLADAFFISVWYRDDSRRAALREVLRAHYTELDKQIDKSVSNRMPLLAPPNSEPAAVNSFDTMRDALREIQSHTAINHATDLVDELRLIGHLAGRALAAIEGKVNVESGQQRG